MKSSLTQRFIITLAALFLLGYVGVQIYVYLGSRYKTETAYLDSVRENAKVSGIVLRQEEVLTNENNYCLYSGRWNQSIQRNDGSRNLSK